MGDKPTRRGKRICVYLAACLMVVILCWGCAAVMPPPRTPDRESMPARYLMLGECLLSKRDFEGAQKMANIVIERFDGETNDQALHLLGMVLIHPDNPKRRVQGAQDAFRRVLEDYPGSPLRADAQTWLALIARMEADERALSQMRTSAKALELQLAVETEKNERLEERLRQMKAVDLTMD